jgi:two-component system OmpR family response regulator
VWDMRFDPESNVVDVHIKNLRRKLAEATGERLLANIRGVGFSLRRRGDSKEPRVTQ